MESIKRAKRALISVYNKDGVVAFARGLQSLGVALLSTGGTFKLLQGEGIAVSEVSAHTGFPEILDGRVKTLHPLIHGGILGKRDDPKHRQQMQAHGIVPIDLVVVNLYPFRETIAKPGVTHEEAIENIDIGGPAMLRSAAKNYNDVAVVVDPADYAAVLAELTNQDGAISDTTRVRLARKVFAYTSDYDRSIAAYFDGLDTGMDLFPQRLSWTFEKVQSLRYGENPHQQAAFYKETSGAAGTLATALKLWGKEMSYNNFLDTHAAFELVKEFTTPACVIVKHNNPCGTATAGNLAEACQKARACDPVSAFGGVVAFNRPLDIAAATALSGTFTEVVIAPEITPDALALLQKKRDLRILTAGSDALSSRNRWDMRRVGGGLLLQEADTDIEYPPITVVSQRPPTAEEQAALRFAWKVCKHVKSNAIVFAQEGETVGIGAGQMSRVDSVKLATLKAARPTDGCVMASDAFFPFRDGIDEAAKAGITAVIQPGGSIRDAEVIAAADEHGMAMLLTGVRHFRH
jgi:phosphoribosylaminoimidazolecarboxamide formyltransferase/IMP cyclohydrolase